MCDDAVAEFACAHRHEARGEDRERLKEIKDVEIQERVRMGYVVLQQSEADSGRTTNS